MTVLNQTRQHASPAGPFNLFAWVVNAVIIVMALYFIWLVYCAGCSLILITATPA